MQPHPASSAATAIGARSESACTIRTPGHRNPRAEDAPELTRAETPARLPTVTTRFVIRPSRVADESLPELSSMLHFEMARRAVGDRTSGERCFSNTENALTAYFGRPINLSELPLSCERLRVKAYTRLYSKNSSKMTRPFAKSVLYSPLGAYQPSPRLPNQSMRLPAAPHLSSCSFALVR